MIDTGMVVALIKKFAPVASPETIQQAVDDYLTEHPEITVEDGSITEEKLASDVLLTLSTLEADVSSALTAIQGKLPIVELTPIDTSMRGVLMDDGTINNQFPNIPIKRYGACSKVYLNGTGDFDVGAHYCYAWIVKNGVMIGNVIPTSYPQVYNNYEITVPADADEIWVNSSGLTLSGYNSYDLSAREKIEKLIDQGIINLYDIHNVSCLRQILSDGSYDYSSQKIVTGYMPVDSDKFYSCNAWDSYSGYYNLFNSNKELIATHKNNIGQCIYISEQNIKYIRIDCPKSKLTNLVFCEGETIPQNLKYPYNDKSIGSDNVVSEYYDLNTIGSIVDGIRPVENLLDLNSEDIVDGKYIYNYTSDGTAQWATASNFMESGYIPIKNGDFYILYRTDTKAQLTQLTHVYCDSEKNGIYNSGEDYHYDSGYGCCFCREPNAAYMRIPIAKTYKDSLMVIRLNPLIDKIPYTLIPYGYIPYGVKVNLPDLYAEKATKTEVNTAITALQTEIDNFVGIGTHWNGKSWYGYGTSITNTSAEGKYPTYLAQISGLVYTNKGISGGGIGDLGAYSHGQVYNAICNVTDGKLNADLITLETGANDCNADVPLGTIYDTGTSTLAGCLNDCIRYLQKNTNAQICIINSPATTTEPTATNKYYEWADMVRRICDINRVHFLNNNCNLGSAKLSDSTKGSLYVVDNIHQTNLGAYIMAQNLWYQLRNIPLFYTTMPS